MLLQNLAITFTLLFCLPAHAADARHPRAAAAAAATQPPAAEDEGSEPTASARGSSSRTAGDVAGSVREFDALLDRVESSGQVAGLAVAVVKDDHVLIQRGIGYANASTGAPVTPDTVFRLASLSKAFASALAGLLIEDGVFGWDTHVTDVVPAFELMDVNASNKLTVRDILSQRVGLPHNTYDRLLEADAPYPQLVDRLREVPLTCEVGECYGYQNITYSLIGDVIYARTGDFFAHQVEKRLFHPLGMLTATYGREALESSKSWARPHARVRSGWVPFDPRDAYYHVAPAAGVNASIKDMTQWLIAQMGGRPDVLTPCIDRHAAHAADPDAFRRPHRTVAAHTRHRRAVRAGLARVRLFRRDTDLPCGRRERLPLDHRVLSEVALRDGAAVELRIGVAGRPVADAARPVSRPAGSRLGGTRRTCSRATARTPRERDQGRPSLNPA